MDISKCTVDKKIHDHPKCDIECNVVPVLDWFEHNAPLHGADGIVMALTKTLIRLGVVKYGGGLP